MNEDVLETCTRCPSSYDNSINDLHKPCAATWPIVKVDILLWLPAHSNPFYRLHIS